MSVVLHRLAVLPNYALAGPPLFLAVALGLTGHHLRTRKATRSR